MEHFNQISTLNSSLTPCKQSKLGQSMIITMLLLFSIYKVRLRAWNTSDIMTGDDAAMRIKALFLSFDKTLRYRRFEYCHFN